MAEATVKLRKAAGGATLTYEGKSYTWKTDGAVVPVPYELAMTLVGIPGAGYAVAGDPASEAAATPGPPADLSRREASPINAKPTAATVKPPAPEPAPVTAGEKDPEPPAPGEPAGAKKS